MQALILAGGRGTRLRPLTDLRPTPLLYLPGGTLLDYLLAHLRRLPVRDIAVVPQYEGEQIARHLAAMAETLTLIPQRPPLTLMGALASAAEWVTEPTLVVHASSYFSTSLHYFVHPLLKTGCCTPTFLVNEYDPGVNRSTRLAEAGAYILPPEAFRFAREIAEADSLLALTAELSVRGMASETVAVRGWQRSVNEASDLLAANRFLLTHWHEIEHPERALIGYDPMTFSWIAPSADVDEHRMGLYVTAGEQAVIKNSRLHNCLVFPGVSLRGAEEEDAIIVETRNAFFRIYAPNGHRASSL